MLCSAIDLEVSTEPPPSVEPPVLWVAEDDDDEENERASLLSRRGRERPTAKKFGERRLTYRRVVFIYLVCFVDVVMMMIELVMNNGIEPFDQNPFIGPKYFKIENIELFELILFILKVRKHC